MKNSFTAGRKKRQRKSKGGKKNKNKKNAVRYLNNLQYLAKKK
jgi:hypothetical protein